MPQLVHIAAENAAADIRRNGIRPTRYRPDPSGHPEHDRVVWAFPVMASYTLTHSWSRELKRWGRTTLAAVTFRVNDTEPVYVGYFGHAKRLVGAAEAVGIVRAEPDPRGYEIQLPRRVAPDEIIRIRTLPHAIGWRYWPGAKNQPMRLCDCPMCLPRREVKARRYRQRVLAGIAELDRQRQDD